MVKKHRNSGADRHYRKHQKIHDRWCSSFQKKCSNCKYIGRAGGFIRSEKACFNKKSKHYMERIQYGQAACKMYELGKYM